MRRLAGLLLLISLSAQAEIYPHVSAYLGSVIGDKTATDGNLPFWGAVGLTYEADRNFEWKFEAFHRSNADRSGFKAEGDQSEYELNGLRAGFEFKFRRK